MERARNTANLLHHPVVNATIERPVLKSLLEVIDCRMTYRSRYFDNLQQNAVLDLCLTDETCPRSVAAQLIALSKHVDALPNDAQSLLKTRNAADHDGPARRADDLVEQLEQADRESQELLAGGSPQILSQVVTRKIAAFRHRQITTGMELPCVPSTPHDLLQ
jgi:uncharacterized alpha-E superfamily protein